MRLKDKIALVAGSGQRMGRAIARLFAQEGAQVVAVTRNAETASRLQEEFKEANLPIEVKQADLTDPSAVEQLMRDVQERYGKLDILVNNLGWRPQPEKQLADLTPEEWRTGMANMIDSFMFLSRAGEPLLEAAGGGSIINISADELILLDANPLYSTGKAAVIGFTRNLARKLYPKNIRVNCIQPGYTRLPANPGEVRPRTEGLVRPYSAPEDIAFAALFLASEESCWLTGVILPVDGGDSVRTRGES